MSKYSLLIILFAFPFISLAQDTLFLQGQILDQETQKPISYATVELRSAKTGVVANEQGFFTLEYPSKFQNDSIEISALGYEKQFFTLKNSPQNEKFYLKSKSIILEEITINQERNIVEIGLKRTKPSGKYNYNPKLNIIAFHQKNSKNIKGYIQSVALFVKKEGRYDAPFRLRLYSVNPESGSPQEDLLPEDVWVKAEKANDWVWIDLEKYNLEFPLEGFFIGVEWVVTDEQYFYEEKDGKYKNEGYGATFSITSAYEDCLTWYYALGDYWINPPESCPINSTWYVNLATRTKIWLID